MHRPDHRGGGAPRRCRRRGPGQPRAGQRTRSTPSRGRRSDNRCARRRGQPKSRSLPPPPQDRSSLRRPQVGAEPRRTHRSGRRLIEVDHIGGGEARRARAARRVRCDPGRGGDGPCRRSLAHRPPRHPCAPAIARGARPRPAPCTRPALHRARRPTRGRARRPGARGVLQLLVEGGASVSREFVAAGLVDRFVVYVAPVLFGGDDGSPAMRGPGAPTIDDVARGRFVSVVRVGEDLRVEVETQ